MQSLQNILRKFLKDFNLEDGIVINSVRSQWINIVGQTIATHTFPDIIKGKVLTLIVDTPQWLHHLSFYKEEIAEKLAHYNIADIRLRQGRLPERTKKGDKRENIKLTDDELRYIENTVKSIKDEELKERFRLLITHGLTQGKGEPDRE